MISIQPFMEQSNLYDQYSQNNKFGIPVDNARYSHAINRPVVTQRLDAHSCPSDSPNAPFSSITSHNYAANFGNTGNGRQANLNGVVFRDAPFSYVSPTTLSRIVGLNSIKDGTSSTFLVGEVLQGKGRDLRGFVWWGDASSFTTYLPPNTSLPDRIYTAYYCNNDPVQGLPCAVSNATDPTMFALRSRHPGGVQVTLCDGSTRFIAETINLNTYRALSTSQGGEPLGDF